MKKKLITAILASGVLFAGLNTAMAADGQVQFNGELTADACQINGGAGGPVTVNLGMVSTSAMAGVGTKSTPTAFTIQLDNCPATLTQAAIKFDGTSDAADNDILALDAASTATGVGIELGEADGTPLPLFTASKAVAITSGSATLDFVGRYKSTVAAPTAGTANSVSDFTINYN